MTIVVAYKYTTNPQDASIGTDGVIDWSRAKSVVSEYDLVAIQLGCNLVDAEGIELVGVTAGKSDMVGSMAKKNAMSKGFDRGVVVADDATAGWNATKVASALMEFVKSVEGADTLLAGDSSIDEGMKIVPALAAGSLGWPALQGISAVAKTADGYEITQNVPDRSRMVVVLGPAVVSVSSDAVAPKVPPMKDILAASKKSAKKVEILSADVEVAVVGRSKPERKARKNKISEGVGAPAQLVAAPRADGVL